jgi:hypothetical protein
VALHAQTLKHLVTHMSFPKIFLVLAALASGCTVIPADPLSAAPLIKDFVLGATVVQPGAALSIQWKTENATHVSITDARGQAVPGVDDQASGNIQWTPTESTVLVLTASNDRGVKALQVASFTVEGTNGSVLFTAHPSVLEAGEAATLLWSAPGAQNVELREVNGAELDLKGQTSSGAVQVNPTIETAYQIQVDGVRRQVTVSRRAHIDLLELSTPTAKAGDMVTLKWKTSHGTLVSASVAGRGELFAHTGSEVAEGQFVDTVPGVPAGGLVSYVFRAEGKGAPVEQVVILQVGTAPEIVSLTAPTYARTGGLFSVSWTTQAAEGLQILSGTQVIYAAPSLAQVRAGQVWLASPTVITDYQLKVSRGAATASKPFTVSPVGPASVTTFTALPATVPVGTDPVTLTWNVPNARHLRVLANGLQTVVSRRGTAAEMGTATVYPNGPTQYVLTTDNGVDAPLSAAASVTVTAPATLGPAGAGPLFLNSTLNLEWSAGGVTPAALVGFPHDQPSSSALMSPAFEDISTTGTKATILNRDDGTFVIKPVDFETFVYGFRVGDRVTVSVNGALTLAGTPTLPTTPGMIPGMGNPAFLLAPYWANLELATGEIYWQMVNEAPARTLVIQWNKVKVKGQPNSELTFQVRVLQTGVISFEYPLLNATSVTPTVGVVGIAQALVGTATQGQRTLFFGPRSPPIAYGLVDPNLAFGFLMLPQGDLLLGFDPATRLVTPTSLFLSEALYSPAAAVSAEGEWLEVRNTSTVPVDLAGWQLDFGAGNVHTLASANGLTVVPAQGTLLLGQAAKDAGNDNVATQYVYGPALPMPDTMGTVVLANDGGFATNLGWNNATSGNGAQGTSVVRDLGPLILASDTGNAPSPHSVNCSSTAAFGSNGQKGSPGTATGCFPYRLEPRAVAFRDISSTGTRVMSSSSPLADGISSDDENWATIDVSSAPVPYFGSPVTSVYVGVNGWLTVAQPGGSLTANFSSKTKPDPLTAPAGVFAPFWDDLDFVDDLTSGVYAQRFAAMADPAEPRAHWVVQWHRFSHYGLATTPDDLNFEVKLFDDGDLELHYGPLSSGTSSNYAAGLSATIWLENLVGTQALMVDPRNTPIRPQSAYRFRPQ